MKIDTVSILNWRSIKKLDITFQDLMIFIGQNNHGILHISLPTFKISASLAEKVKLLYQ